MLMGTKRWLPIDLPIGRITDSIGVSFHNLILFTTLY